MRSARLRRWAAPRAKRRGSGSASRWPPSRWPCRPGCAGPAFDALLALLHERDQRQAGRGRRIRHRPGAAARQAELPHPGQAVRRGRRRRSPAVRRTLDAGGAAAARAGRHRWPARWREAIELAPEDVVVEREVVTDWPVASDGPYVVALDPSVTPELAQRRPGAGTREPDPASPQGCRLRCDHPHRALASTAMPRWSMPRAGTSEYIAHETLAREFHVGHAAGDASTGSKTVVIDDHDRRPRGAAARGRPDPFRPSTSDDL